MKNEKRHRNYRGIGWAWRKHGILFGKSDPNNPKDFMDGELERIQMENDIKNNAFITSEKTS